MSQQTDSIYDQRCSTFFKAYVFNVLYIQQKSQLFYTRLFSALASRHHETLSKNKGTENFTTADLRWRSLLYINIHNKYINIQKDVK